MWTSTPSSKPITSAVVPHGHQWELFR
jgi:hypothetical protein